MFPAHPVTECMDVISKIMCTFCNSLLSYVSFLGHVVYLYFEQSKSRSRSTVQNPWPGLFIKSQHCGFIRRLKDLLSLTYNRICVFAHMLGCVCTLISLSCQEVEPVEGAACSGGKTQQFLFNTSLFKRKVCVTKTVCSSHESVFLVRGD